MDAKMWLAAIGITTAAFAVHAVAQTAPSASGFYVGANVGQAKYHFSCGAGCDQDTTPTSFRLLAGYRFNRIFSAELGYDDLGRARYGLPGASATLSAEVYDLSALAAWPLGNRFSLFGRLGLYHGTLKQSGSGTFGTGKGVRDDLTWGIGGQFEMTPALGLRGEWQRFSKMGGGDFVQEADVDSLSLGIVWRF